MEWPLSLRALAVAAIYIAVMLVAGGECLTCYSCSGEDPMPTNDKCLHAPSDEITDEAFTLCRTDRQERGGQLVKFSRGGEMSDNVTDACTTSGDDGRDRDCVTVCDADSCNDDDGLPEGHTTYAPPLPTDKPPAGITCYSCSSASNGSDCELQPTIKPQMFCVNRTYCTVIKEIMEETGQLLTFIRGCEILQDSLKDKCYTWEKWGPNGLEGIVLSCTMTCDTSLCNTGTPEEGDDVSMCAGLKHSLYLVILSAAIVTVIGQGI